MWLNMNSTAWNILWSPSNILMSREDYSQRSRWAVTQRYCMERGHFQQKRDMETKHSAGNLPSHRKKKMWKASSSEVEVWLLLGTLWKYTLHAWFLIYNCVSQHVSSPTFALPLLIQKRRRKRPYFSTKISEKPWKGDIFAKQELW